MGLFTKKLTEGQKFLLSSESEYEIVEELSTENDVVYRGYGKYCERKGSAINKLIYTENLGNYITSTHMLENYDINIPVAVLENKIVLKQWNFLFSEVTDVFAGNIVCLSKDMLQSEDDLIIDLEDLTYSVGDIRELSSEDYFFKSNTHRIMFYVKIFGYDFPLFTKYINNIDNEIEKYLQNYGDIHKEVLSVLARAKAIYDAVKKQRELEYVGEKV